LERIQKLDLWLERLMNIWGWSSPM
jgi:hypothetical protein